MRRSSIGSSPDGDALTISGGSDVAALYGAYAFAEKLGVRFYLDGDVIPDTRIPFAIPPLDETRQPLFEHRGIQPFHDFPEGPDWWNQDDYLAYLSQLAKLRMNFLGLHCYPEGGVGPEPLVWIGLTNDLAADGTVKFSYPSFWANTSKGTWGYAPMKTSEFAGGAARLFPADDYGPDVMAGLMPRPVTPEQCNEMFNRVGRQMNAVFAAARQLGVKTCIGTETPLTIPKSLRDRLVQLGYDPESTNTVRALYTGMFKRIAAAFPVDYYWLWTPEDWTWGGNKPGQLEATTRDIRLALGALDDLGNPFTLATSGWVLGPAHNRAALDEFLPKNSPDELHQPPGRPRRCRACICQCASDGRSGRFPGWKTIRTWSARSRGSRGCGTTRWTRAASAARACLASTGATKALAPNVAALAAAAWDQSWVPAGFDTRPVKPSKGGEGAIGGTVASFNAPVASADNAPAAVYQNVRYNLEATASPFPTAPTPSPCNSTSRPTPPAASAFSARCSRAAKSSPISISSPGSAKTRRWISGFPDIPVTNGTLRIDFTREVEFPCIAGIVIDGKTRANNQLPGEAFTRKINCGGEKVADYEADRVSDGAPPPSPRDRAMPIEDFYVDFARANFGDAVAGAAGRIFARMDGVRMPQASDWKNGPGNLVANPKPWSEVKPSYCVRRRIRRPASASQWRRQPRALRLLAEHVAGRLRDGGSLLRPGPTRQGDGRKKLHLGLDQSRGTGAGVESATDPSNRHRQHPGRTGHDCQPRTPYPPRVAFPGRA